MKTTNPTRKDLLRKIGELETELRQQKRLKQFLIDSEDISESIVENSISGIYVLMNGTFLAVNTIAASYTGYSVAELIGKKTDSILHPEDKAEVNRNARAMLKGERSAPYEFRIVTQKNEVRWVMETVTSILFQGKRAILGNAMDITERKEVEQRLKESEDLYRAIFETAVTATIIIEEDMTISLLNSEFEKLTGYKKEEWEGKKKWTEYVAKKDLARMKAFHHRRRVHPTSAPRNYEHDLIDSHGRIRKIFLAVDMIPGTKKSIASFTDITEWTAAEKALKRREKELQSKSRNLEELNTTLRVLLRQREDDREELEDKVLSNIKQFVMPYLDRIRKCRMETKATAYIDILESNLKDIVSPFSRKLSSKYLHLTTKEIQVANFVKEGKTSKEIADVLNLSKSAVDIHRYRLRNKLGLNNKKANLRSHLSALS
jgi:PAS domain S-box-containing protein